MKISQITSIIIFIIICSFIGWYIEYINELTFCRKEGEEPKPNYSIFFCKDKGKIPLLPIYGIGILILYVLTHTLFKGIYNSVEDIGLKGMTIKNIVIIGLTVTVIMTIFELVCGVGAEKITGKRLWDYRSNFGNFMGYIDVWHSCAWFILGTICISLIIVLGVKIH